MLAMIRSPSPAASMTSPSIFSVAVARTPLVPPTVSRSSSRVGGRSCRTVTSKPSSTRRPASGISRVTRTFSGTAASLAVLLEEFPEDGLEDTAVAQVLDLDRRVHPRLDPELLRLAFVARRPDGQLGAGRDASDARDVVRLVAGEAQGLCALAFRVLEGEDAHPDQVRAVGALEALGDDRPNAEQEGALRGPVARGAGPVLLARDHQQRHALLCVLEGGLVDRRLLPVGEVDRVAAFLLHELVPEANVAEGAPHHHLVVAAPGAVGVEVARVHALAYEVLPGRHLRGDRARRRDVVGGDRVPDLDEHAGPLYVPQGLRFGREALEEGRLLDVGGVGVPLVEVAGGHVHLVPLLVAGVDVGVLALVDLRVQGALYLLGYLGLRGPDVLEVDGVASLVLSERVVDQVQVHGPCQGVGDDERRRGEVIGPHVGVDAPLEVAVAREDGGDHEVVLVYRLAYGLGQRPGVADARGAAVANDVEPELLQVVQQARGLQVLGDDLGARREARLDVWLHRQALLDRLLREQPGPDHDRGVRRVGAAGDRSDDRRAVPELGLLAVERDGDGTRGHGLRLLGLRLAASGGVGPALVGDVSRPRGGVARGERLGVVGGVALARGD